MYPISEFLPIPRSEDNLHFFNTPAAISKAYRLDILSNLLNTEGEIELIRLDRYPKPFQSGRAAASVAEAEHFVVDAQDTPCRTQDLYCVSLSFLPNTHPLLFLPLQFQTCNPVMLSFGADICTVVSPFQVIIEAV